MEYRLDDHAVDQMRARRISSTMLDDVLQRPEQIVAGKKGRSVYQSRIELRGKAFLLRAIVQTGMRPPLVVSVYATDNIGKYWDAEVEE